VKSLQADDTRNELAAPLPRARGLDLNGQFRNVLKKLATPERGLVSLLNDVNGRYPKKTFVDGSA
jgi:hypothetical protein